jgi:hypothetical protein
LHSESETEDATLLVEALAMITKTYLRKGTRPRNNHPPSSSPASERYHPTWCNYALARVLTVDLQEFFAVFVSLSTSLNLHKNEKQLAKQADEFHV